jgi:hypothetical protein
MNVSGLIEKVKFGDGLTPIQIVTVYTRLLETTSDSERYSALHILGLTNSTQYRSAVEGFLTWPQDPMVSGMALKVLCRYWDLMDEYIDRVIHFLRGAEWDEEDWCRLAATNVCGSYLAVKRNVALLEAVVCLFDDRSVKPLIRESAYIAMCEAGGMLPKDLPSGGGKMEERGRIDWSIVDRIKERLAAEKNQERI